MSSDINAIPTNVLVENVNSNTQETKDFTSNFNIECEIGRGRFAKVCKVIHKSNESFVAAAKIIRRFRNGNDTYDAIQREIDILHKSKGHPYIVNIIDHYVNKREVSVILEYSSFGDLYRHLTNRNEALVEKDVQMVMSQLVHALSFVHSQSIVHLDIKPENILIKSLQPHYTISLCDFGVAKYLDKNTIIRNLVGTPDYAAPEILDFNPIHLKTDIWSAGVVAYFLLTGESPFWADTKEKTFGNVTSMRIDFESELLEDSSPAAISFMKRTIVRQPDMRPSSEELLKDPWLSDQLPTENEHLSKSSESLVQPTNFSERSIPVS